MAPPTREEFSTRLIDWSTLVIMGNTVSPRDPDEDDEDDEEEGRYDEPPVVREPDEDLEHKSQRKSRQSLPMCELADFFSVAIVD